MMGTTTPKAFGTGHGKSQTCVNFRRWHTPIYNQALDFNDNTLRQFRAYTSLELIYPVYPEHPLILFRALG